MNTYFCGMFDCIKRKKGYFFVLLILSLLAIILGVIAAINFDSALTIDLDHIAYIKFLQGGASFLSMTMGLILSILIFFLLISACHAKPYLIILAVVFYSYLVYSQAVIFMSIVLVYGILNCIILALLLLIYSLFIWTMFLLLCCELSCFCNTHNYFKTCFSWKNCKALVYLCCCLIATLLFAIILSILKNYVLLLVFE